MQATEFDHERIEAAGDVKTLAPGQRFTPYDVSKSGPAYEPHIVLEIEHVMIHRRDGDVDRLIGARVPHRRWTHVPAGRGGWIKPGQ